MADLVGREVLKKFGRKAFTGQIDKFFEDKGWYHVTYEDGDEEELTAAQVSNLLVASQPPPEAGAEGSKPGAASSASAPAGPSTISVATPEPPPEAASASPGAKRARKILPPNTTQRPKRSASAAKSSEDLVGREVLKKFGKEAFKGKIDKFYEEKGWYHVTYEDGDEEELTFTQVSPILVAKPEATPEGAVEAAPEGAVEAAPEGSKAPDVSQLVSPSDGQSDVISTPTPAPDSATEPLPPFNP